MTEPTDAELLAKWGTLRAEKIVVPTDTMEQEFQAQYLRGFAAGKKANQPAHGGEPVGEIVWAAGVPNSIREVHLKKQGLPIGTKLYTAQHETEAIAAWNRRAPAAVAGWKLVPVEPTPEMLRAGDQKTWVLPARDCWRAMLAAAPTPPAQVADSVLKGAGLLVSTLAPDPEREAGETKNVHCIELAELLKEARKIIRASSSRQLAKDWDRRATQALRDINHA